MKFRARFAVGHNSVEWNPSTTPKWRYDITVFYNNCKFTWHANHNPCITKAKLYIGFAKAEFEQQTEAAKYE